ncbi:unnamed protein product [Polarella glacialis]|uniref:Uncharacterized protein n=1 Tax=Polarella glacialis TaxID=89957 RepID=A0A813KAT3_POLGL|nr:unnamed protein product [Polarella glacialis]
MRAADVPACGIVDNNKTNKHSKNKQQGSAQGSKRQRGKQANPESKRIYTETQRSCLHACSNHSNMYFVYSSSLASHDWCARAASNQQLCSGQEFFTQVLKLSSHCVSGRPLFRLSSLLPKCGRQRTARAGHALCLLATRAAK